MKLIAETAWHHEGNFLFMKKLVSDIINKTNADIGVPSTRIFENEVKKYCYMWKEGGQFSTEKYLTKKDVDN